MPPFQSTVTSNMGLGVVGDIFDDGPRRCQPFILVADGDATNLIGRAFTMKAGLEGVAEPGRDGVQPFAGILVNSKEYALYGVPGNAFGASLTLADNVIGELLSEGSIIVSVPAAAGIGDAVFFDLITGAISTALQAAATPAGTAKIVGAYVDRFIPTAAGLAVITLSPSSRSA